MSDQKRHTHHHNHIQESGKRLMIAFFLNLFFTVIEIIGSIFTGSIAILSDALHDLGDSLSLGLAWYLEKFSRKGRDEFYSYGYRRFSLLGAVINAVVLSAGSVVILVKAIPALTNPGKVNADGMIVLAVFGVLFNGLAVLRTRKGSSVNEKVVNLHLLEDVLGWIAVLAGSILIKIFEWMIIDPILSCLIVAFVLFNVAGHFRELIRIIFQRIPENVSLQTIRNFLKNIPGISSFHDLHIWSMDGEYNVLTVHLVIDRHLDVAKIEKLKETVRAGLNELNIRHATLEIEFPGAACESCD